MPEKKKKKRIEGYYSDPDWTSEDMGNPVYSKRRQLSDKEARKLIIEDPRLRAGQRFNKGAQILYGSARLVPGTVGLTTDILDTAYGWYTKKPEENIFDSTNAGIRSSSGWLDLLNNRILRKSIGSIPYLDTAIDATQLYDIWNRPLDEYKKGGKIRLVKKQKQKV
jgi:hypothetical protein